MTNFDKKKTNAANDWQFTNCLTNYGHEDHGDLYENEEVDVDWLEMECIKFDILHWISYNLHKFQIMIFLWKT